MKLFHSIRISVFAKPEENKEEISPKIWIWIAIGDILAIVITGLLIFSRY